jgi:signal transduction histidine kinase
MTATPPERRASLQGPLWRAIAVFRLAALAYAVALILGNRDRYAHPHAAWPVLAALAGWTVFTWWAYAHPAWRRWPLLAADLVVTVAVVLASPVVVGRPSLKEGTPTLAVAWLAAPVLAWAVAGGRRRGLVAALVVGAAEMSARGNFQQSTTTGVMLMILAAVAVGHVARLAVEAEERLQRAVEMEAATRERERLARGIHDSVLQVLAMVQRRGAHLDGAAGEIARLAGEQEAALRALVTSGPTGRGDNQVVDLRTVLSGYAGAAVSVATPADPVPLPAGLAGEVGAAVRAVLDNVERHGGPGAQAWVLVEDEPGSGPAARSGKLSGAVTVTVRDDGPGIPAGRLAEAAAQGRLGVAQSIRGRVADLGGTVRITSAPGEGTEVELRIPRAGPGPGATLPA